MAENKTSKRWKNEKLRDVCKILNGYGFPKNIQGSNYGSIPFYKVGDISKNVIAGNRYLDFCDNYIDDEVLLKLRAKAFPQNTIVFAKIGEGLKLNRRAIITVPGIVDNNAIGLKANEAICDDMFLYHFLTVVKLEDYSKATTVPSVRKSEIEEITIPLPPLPEQQRIVAKIEELFSELDKGVESLKTAQQQLKVYRQAVLKYAFEGKFTEEWRRQQIAKKQPQMAIAAEPMVEYKPTQQNGEELGVLPEGWKWVSLDEISEMCLGKMLDKEKNKGSFFPYLRNINVRWGYFELEDLEEMKFEEHETERYSVIKGDLVICEGGEPGRCAIWESDKPIRIQKALHRVRINKKYLSKLIYYYFFLIANLGVLEKYFTGTTIKHFTGKELKKVIIPLPQSMKEQHYVVSEIERRLLVCDKTEESIGQGLKQAEALRQSILKRAFEGRLV